MPPTKQMALPKILLRKRMFPEVLNMSKPVVQVSAPFRLASVAPDETPMTVFPDLCRHGV